MNTNGRFRPCETKWYFVRNEDKKIVIHNSSNRPLKKDGRDWGRSEYFYFKKWQERRKVEGKSGNALYIRIKIKNKY